jgi:S-adenosylmethionine-diacylgycerolhomoserine-N-methlytransferase
MNMENVLSSSEQATTIQGYYRLHARIYDLTRWTFLFGRREILKRLQWPVDTEETLLEVGCGTGYNLRRFATRFPKCKLIGVDVSTDMLEQASKNLAPFSGRVHFIEQPYAPGAFQLEQQPDVVLCAYSLTMFNPGWEEALARAYADLPVGGKIAVVDFHQSPSRFFTWWMGKNHVRMDGHLLPYLETHFHPIFKVVRKAYGGVWAYMLFVGEKK